MKTKKRRVVGALLAFGFLVFLAAELPAQVANGKRFEFSTSASVWNVKWEPEGETQTIINLPLRLGFFVWKGLEFEPELLLTIWDEAQATGYVVFGNIAYNHALSDTFLGFLLAGMGIGNGLPAGNLSIDLDESVVAYNFGLGVKGIFGNSAALRLEYRFIGYSEEGDRLRTDRSILVGVSIFF